MVTQSFAFSIFLFIIIACILLVLLPSEQKRTNKLEVDIPYDEKNPNEKEIIVDQKVVPQKIETELKQEVITNKQASTELEQLRTVGHRKFKVRSFHIQKQGLNEAECEDKNALSDNNSSSLRVAVADGATESLFSDIWADILVKSYVQQGGSLLQTSGLESANQEFLQKTSQLILEMPETRQWFMYEKLERGTYATLAAVEISSSLEKVQILTVGDSCVFWCCDDKEVNMLPKLSPEEFGSLPDCICHLSKAWQNLEEKIKKKEISLQNTLQMVLCTDALACWLITELKSKPSSWERLFKISDYDSFTRFIETLREQNNIRNDDVTVVLIDALPFNV